MGPGKPPSSVASSSSSFHFKNVSSAENGSSSKIARGSEARIRAMLSRAVAGTRGGSLILNLPGAEKAARENLSAVIGALEHAMHMLAAEGHG